TKKNDLLQLMLDSSVVDSGDVDVSRLEAGNAELEKGGSEGSEASGRFLITAKNSHSVFNYATC
ncbi:hypothetical protein AVEN_232508-1, partial [Araneus ventricosus]